MEEKRLCHKLGAKQMPWFGMGFVILVITIAAVMFSSIPGKIARNLRELSSPPIVKVTDEKNLALQIEQRLRAEFEEKLKTELQELKARNQEEENKVQASELLTTSALGSITDVRQLRSGIPFQTKLTLEQGKTAISERFLKDSYAASYELKLRVPTAAATVDELIKANPKLAKILPGLPGLLEKGKVSPAFAQLYKNKTDRVRTDVHTLNELLTKHNFYDCDTILHLTSEKGRKIFFMQADMDVVSDGSDGDRLATMPESIVNSTHYQPFTSYGWKKRTSTPNPMIAGWEKRIAAGTVELNAPNTSAERKTWLKERITQLKRGIEDLKSRSYLVAEYDPFIVIPIHLLTSRSDKFAPKVGDYAVVIFGEKVYPCIVGDGGPTFKVGEASLRLAKEINSKATPYNRPVSDLAVSYVVFPNSREANAGVPDYQKWRSKCSELLQEMGGLGDGYNLHEWTNLFPSSLPASE